MKRCFAVSLGSTLSLCLALVLATPALAQVTETVGQAANGSYYRFQVPDGWTPADGLVIWNHGFSLSPISTEPDLGPLAQVQLDSGYAVAASSYSQIGWALFQTEEDLELMYEAFVAEYGEPESVIVSGGSLGGIVTIQAIEQADLGNVVGALPICGALAGSRGWDGAFDLRLIYDYLCNDVPGGAIPGGSTGLPFPPDPAFDDVALAGAVNTCLGILLPADLRTDDQKARLETMLKVSQLPENFILTDMGFATFGLFDLTFDPGKLAGGQALGNADVDYGDADVNAGIQRVTADPEARAHFADYYTPTGKVGDVKIVSIHTDGDGLVLLEQESDYAAKVPASNFTLGVVVEDVPSHCDFSEAEVAAAWADLSAWIATDVQPSAAKLQGTCEGLLLLPDPPEGPCRIDPMAVVPDISDRIRPRAVCTPDDDTLCLDDGRFIVEAEWTDFDGNSGVGMALPQTNDTGAFYFFDEGNFELVVKVLDGRQINGKHWVFYGSLSNVEYTITVTDTVTGRTAVYENDLGNFGSNGDTDAI